MRPPDLFTVRMKVTGEICFAWPILRGYVVETWSGDFIWDTRRSGQLMEHFEIVACVWGRNAPERPAKLREQATC